MVVGRPLTSNGVVCTNGWTTDFPSSSIATPSSVKPLSAYFCWNSISQGISSRHGSHQVAQKFTTTTLPFRLASVTSLPSRSLNVTSGAAGLLPCASAADVPTAPELALPEWHAAKFVVTIKNIAASNKKLAGLPILIRETPSYIYCLN